MSYIWRCSKSPEAVAKGFANFCKTNSLVTRGMCRVGRTPRGLRGLVAAQDIKADESVIIVPDNAIITCFDPLRSQSFLSAVTSSRNPNAVSDLNDVFPYSKLHTRVGTTFLYDHHVMLALFITHLLLAPPETEKFRDYIDYLPRGEANFHELTLMLERAIDHCQTYTRIAPALCAAHHVSVEDLRAATVWALTMVISRSIPIEHTRTLEKFAEGAGQIERDLVEKEKNNTPNASCHVSALIPLIDMLNHDENPNVAIAVPDVESSKRRAIIARSLRPIAKGEELSMMYAGQHDPQLLSVFYGMQYIPTLQQPRLQ